VYEDAFLAVVGRRMELLADMAGRTDRYIIETTLALHGIEEGEALLEPFYEELGRAVRSRTELLRANGRALAGAAAALDAVARVPSVVQSVVAGNTREIASEKLSAFGLDEPPGPRGWRLRQRRQRSAGAGAPRARAGSAQVRR